MSLRSRMEKTIGTGYSIERSVANRVVIEASLGLGTGLTGSVTLKQHDHKSRVLHLTLETDILNRVDLTDTRVYLIIQYANTQRLCLEGNIISATTGVVEFPFTKEFLSVSGQATCEVVVVGDDSSTLSFPTFNLTIQPSIYDETILGLKEGIVEDFTSIDDIEIMQLSEK